MDFEKINLNHVLAWDIETAPIQTFNENSPLFPIWKNKLRKENLSTKELIERFYTEAGLYPSFGTIVCISAGFFHQDKIHLRSFCGTSEKEIVDGFLDFVSKFVNNRGRVLHLGHNIIDFDLPFLRRSYSKYYNMFSYPVYMSDIGKKPWDMEELALDTMKLYKGTSFTFTSMAEVAVMLGLPSPKIDTDGSQVGKMFTDGKLSEIQKYCEGDVLTTINILLKWMNKFPMEVKGTSEKVELPESPIITKLINTGKISALEKKRLEVFMKEQPAPQVTLIKKTISELHPTFEWNT